MSKPNNKYTMEIKKIIKFNYKIFKNNKLIIKKTKYNKQRMKIKNKMSDKNIYNNLRTIMIRQEKVLKNFKNYKKKVQF